MADVSIFHDDVINPKAKKNCHFFTNLAPHMTHDEKFYEKKLYILLALHSIYQKQKPESVYLILKNNYGPFSETHTFQKFPQLQQQK